MKMYHPRFAELTICGWGAAVLCVAMILGVSVSIFLYVRSPVFHQGVAVLLAMGVAWMAFGVFHLSHLCLNAIGFPLWHRSHPLSKTDSGVSSVPRENVGRTSVASQKFAAKYAKLISVLLFGWVIASLAMSIFAYDRLVGPRADTTTDLIFFAGCSTLSFGPVLLVYRLLGIQLER